MHYLCFFLQAKIRRIFKRMADTETFWESVKVAVGLSGMTSVFTNHLLQLFVDDEIELMRGKIVEDLSGCFSAHLIPLAECAKEMPSAATNIFCNSHISFVTRVPWEMRSKLYIFGEMQDDLRGLSQGKGSFPTEVPEKCSISVCKPSIGFADTLRVISNLKQPISNLYLKEIQGPVVIDKPVFTLDSEAKCMSIDWPEMPLLEQKNLGNQISRCNCIERLIIPDLPMIAQAVVPKLGNFKHLVSLDFAFCQLPNEICYSACTHLRSMQKLEELDLRENSIGYNGTEALVDSILSWGSNSPLRILALINSEIPSGLGLLKALTCCRKLQFLYLSQNPLAGSLKDLPPNVHFPELYAFHVSDISLTGEDIQALAAVIKNKGMPLLDHLDFGYNQLSDTKYDLEMVSDQPLQRLNLADESVETLQALKCILGDSDLGATVNSCCGDTKHAFVTNIDSELQRRFSSP